MESEDLCDIPLITLKTGNSEQPLHYPTLAAVQKDSIPFNLVAALECLDVLTLRDSHM